MAALLPLYIKQAYKDEPAIASAKIVTAIYNQSPDQIMGNTLKDSLLYKDVTKQFLDNYKDDIDGMEIAKIAIDNSDGIIAAQADSNEAVMTYAREAGKKILEYPGEDNTAAYTKFFDTL